MLHVVTWHARVLQWRDGFVSGSVYSGEPELMELLGRASSLYSISNPLHPDLFPSVMKFEVCSVMVAPGLRHL
jgi:sphinganine-1-phosphate aldolase